MIKVDKTVLKEVQYITFMIIVLSLLMNSVFLILHRWDYTVLLGNILSAAVSVVNFLLMGITIQKALSKDSAEAKKLIKASQNLRNFGIFVVLGAGVLLPIFNTISVIVPIFFPRIAIFLRPLWKEKGDRGVIKDEQARQEI